ncbi:uncharacterized protein LOC133848625 [Drosophila sulfurigaster albostrigata]|uniref:uncharacterized protein LOC133848625 n=1 Tax=Drosophila sulfurigaster albostrigata TaxID=89887 RepID=UPI002D2192FD|nr:uncharacterized protein LOC133848625 [Drosophila sulfurigaster albostrigata]XP_062140246.1 uncharacterized protein LOC133848625 [Drosophila sulfurigaster albostrigata]
MQPTSSRFFGCLWKQQLSSMMRRQLQLQKITSRQLASKGGRNKVKMMSQRETSTQTQTPTPNLAHNLTPAHPMRRETNMWKDPLSTDTKWLSARDPRRYRPDFGQTEPHSLRKQFMRSPDERTRDAMTRDWEAATQLNEIGRRQAQLVAQQRHHDKMYKQLDKSEVTSRLGQSQSKYAAKQQRHHAADQRSNED